MRAFIRPILVVAAALIPAGCGVSAPGTVAPGPPGRSPSRCVIAAGTASSAASGDEPAVRDVRVALESRVDPAHAPVGVNAGERLVFRQLYQTLVRIDCDGRVRPGLATSWSHDADGARWRFVLRGEARFWDGSPLTAQAVAQSWASPAPGAPRSGPPLVIAFADALGPHELSVYLSEPSTSPAVFARPSLAVIGPDAEGPWPMGTGPYRPVVSDDLPRGDVRLAPVEAEGGATLTFTTSARGDAREALDAGADVVVSDDPAVIAYAGALPDFVTAPLPWSRTYVLVAEAGAEPQDTAPMPPGSVLSGLARGAVRADARGAKPPFWWRESSCMDVRPADSAEPVPPAVRPPPGRRQPARGRPPAPPVPPGRNRRTLSRVVYPRDDAVARSLAERIVALMGRGPGAAPWLSAAVPDLGSAAASPLAVGLDPILLASTVRAREALAYVVPVSRMDGVGCAAARLFEDEPGTSMLTSNADFLITPLVDVRSSLLVRRGIGGISVDGDGTLVFDTRGAGR